MRIGVNLGLFPHLALILKALTARADADSDGHSIRLEGVIGSHYSDNN